MTTAVILFNHFYLSETLLPSLNIGVFHYPSGEMIATLQGHSDLVTGLVFSYDCQFLISVSGDSCIFVWRLPKKMSTTMASKLNITLSEETCSSAEATIEEFGSPTKALKI